MQSSRFTSIGIERVGNGQMGKVLGGDCPGGLSAGGDCSGEFVLEADLRYQGRPAL